MLTLVEENVDQITPLSSSINVNASAINDTKATQIIIRGLNFDVANSIYHFDYKVIEGRIPTTLNEIALGLEFKETIDVKLNDLIKVDVALVGTSTVTVVGFIDFKVS